MPLQDFRVNLGAAALSFAAGVALLQLLPGLPPLLPVLATTAGLLLVALRWRHLWWLAISATGFAWALLHACAVLCEHLPVEWENRDLILTGAVAGLPQGLDTGTRFLFAVDEARHQQVLVPFSGLVRISWYDGAPALAAGEGWRLQVRLKRPHGFSNPGGFDYERWLFQQGIKATGYVRGSTENRRLDAGPGAYWIDRQRQTLRSRIARALGDGPTSGLVQALLLGDRGGIAPAQWEVLTRTGTNHLIAISGLHVGILSGFAFFLARWLWLRSERLTLWLAAPRAAALVAWLTAFAYSALAGFAISTQRSLVMLSVILGAVLLRRPVRPAAGLAVALGGVLLWDPLAVLAYGFWLSFGAVALILYGMSQRSGRPPLWQQWGRVQWLIALGLLPLLLLLFGRASVLAPLVNLVAVPLFSLVLLPALLLASALSLLTGFDWPLQMAARGLGWGFDGLETLAAWPGAAATLSARPPWVWALAFGAAVLLLAPRGLPGRWLGAVLLLPMWLERPPAPAPGDVWLTLLDVGQGLAAVVQTERHLLVYDTGPAFPSGFNTGEAVLLPYLREAGRSRIDLLVVSHGDKDHAGGVQGLIGGVPVTRIWSGEPTELPKLSPGSCRAGLRWRWDGVDFRILHPPTDYEGNSNNRSCVLRVENVSGSVLLTGDIERGVERALIQRYGDELSSSLLVAAHHGSAGSTSGDFLATVQPRVVLFSAGHLNRFGFPSEWVRQRVMAQGSAMYATASSGAITYRFSSDGRVEGPVRHRWESGHYWTHRPAPLARP